jgi:hypothetical protein
MHVFGRLVGILIVTVVVSFDAPAQQSFQQLESSSEFGRALAAIEAIKRSKKLQCLMAISNRKLCECLSRNLPVDTYVRSYASISGKKGIEYEQLPVADKRIVDQCVSDNP